MTSIDYTLKYLHTPESIIWSSENIDFKLLESLYDYTIRKIKSLSNRKEFIRDYVQAMQGRVNPIIIFLANNYPNEYFQRFRIYDYLRRLHHNHDQTHIEFESILWDFLIAPNYKEYANILYYKTEMQKIINRRIFYILEKK